MNGVDQLAGLSRSQVLDRIRDKLEYSKRLKPIYTSAFHDFLKELHCEPYVSNKNLRQEFFAAFEGWILGSKLNSIQGLEAFPRRDTILGVAQSLDDIHFVHKGRVVVFPREYKYHHLINPEVTVKNWDELEAGDVLILSHPFSGSGDEHPGFQLALERAEKVGAEVHLDCAWFGCTRGLDFNVDLPPIKSISFSLGKGLGLGRHRFGVRYARNRWDGPVCATNDSDYPHDSLMWISIKFIEKFGSDYLQDNYYPLYQEICRHYDFKETSSIFVAWDPNHEYPQMVGGRPVLRWLAEGRW